MQKKLSSFFWGFTLIEVFVTKIKFMKKKELSASARRVRDGLIIFLLAGLLMGINFLNNHYNTWQVACTTGQGPWQWWNFPMQVIGNNFLSRILLKPPSCSETESGLICPTIFIGPDYCLILGAALFFFWFLVLTMGWRVVKKLNKSYKD